MGLLSQIDSSKRSNLTPVRSVFLGELEARLTKCDDEISQVLDMRAQIFKLPASVNVDKFDAVCDHLIVLNNFDDTHKQASIIVGTYRLLREEHAALAGGFYSAAEFEIAPMFEQNSGLKFLEFGRSCVLPDYRGKRTIELLWAGSWAYIKNYDIDVLFGCASFSGSDPQQHQEALSFLYHFAAADKKFNVKATPKFKGELNLLSKDQIDTKRAIRNLPPMIKGYLRVGAKFSTQIAIDAKFNTVDVLTVLPVSDIKKRYIKYYGAKDER